MGPWPNTWMERPHAPAPSPEEGPWTWESVAQGQQRLWAQWTEASQTWLQWWMTSLPQMSWPPVGVVIDPAPLEAPPSSPGPLLARAPVTPDAGNAKAPRARRSAPARRDAPKLNGGRHH
jgi:hypothetical protein